MKQSKYLVIFCLLFFSGCQVGTSQTKKPLQSPITPFQGQTMDKQKTDLDIAKRLVKEPAKQEKVAYVLNQTQKMGLPATLAVVPMVESNYKTQTVSPKGAAGDWQLMPALAKEYGVSSQQRFNFPVATKAALEYLKELHAQFGSWQLAFAAYNAGEHKVARALAQRPNTQEVSKLNLPLETKNYVAKIMNLNQIIMRA